MAPCSTQLGSKTPHKFVKNNETVQWLRQLHLKTKLTLILKQSRTQQFKNPKNDNERKDEAR